MGDDLSEDMGDAFPVSLSPVVIGVGRADLVCNAPRCQRSHRLAAMAMMAAMAATIIGACTAALAQGSRPAIPSSEMPGRERDRFTDPPALSRSGGTIFTPNPTFSPPAQRYRHRRLRHQ
jgi:hypothetical protein